MTYQTSQIEGPVWQYQYAVLNDTQNSTLQEFTVFFDSDLYDSLKLVASPPAWDSLLIQPDPGIPAEGFLDSLSQTGGLANGQFQDGFAVEFTWLGIGTPGSQRFDVIDPVTFATLQSGTTLMAAPIPVPASLWLMSAGLLLLAAVKRRFGRRQAVLHAKA